MAKNLKNLPKTMSQSISNLLDGMLTTSLNFQSMIKYYGQIRFTPNTKWVFKIGQELQNFTKSYPQTRYTQHKKRQQKKTRNSKGITRVGSGSGVTNS